MTLFGVIWILAITIAFSRSDIKPMMFLTLLGMIFQSNNVIVYKSFYVGPQLITSAAFIVKSMLYTRFVIRYQKRNIGFIILLGCFYCYIVANAIILGNFDAIWINIIQLGIYAWAFMQMVNVAQYISENYLFECVKIITAIIIVVGIVQLLYDLLELPRYTIFRDLFYNDNIGGSVCYYRNVKRFYSTFMEPSYCAGVLVGLIFFFLENQKKLGTKLSWKYISVLIICVILTESSTAYGTLAIVAAVFTLRNLNKKYIWKIIPIGVILFAFLYFGTDFLNTAIFEKMMTSSGRTRMRLDQWAYESFQEAPWLGIGYKNCRASSMIPTLLGELGMIGAVLFILFIGPIVMESLKKNSKKSIAGTSYIVMCMTISMFIACPDLDLCTFWLAMYFFAIAIGCRNESNDQIIRQERV